MDEKKLAEWERECKAEEGQVKEFLNTIYMKGNLDILEQPTCIMCDYIGMDNVCIFMTGKAKKVFTVDPEQEACPSAKLQGFTSYMNHECSSCGAKFHSRTGAELVLNGYKQGFHFKRCPECYGYKTIRQSLNIASKYPAFWIKEDSK